ncbi:hypothetical protein [Sphingopyxis chilensis]
MTLSVSAEASARLYSQTANDERGNVHYEGDLFRQGEALPALCGRIERHLLTHVAGATFSVRGESFAGGRKVIVELLDATVDLTDEADRRAFEEMLRDQIERFGFTRSNFYQDFMAVAFYNEVRIGRAYWAALAARRGPANRVEPLVTLAAFKRRLKPGDTLKLIAAPEGHRALGTTRKIVAVRSNDLIFEGKIYLDFPRASGFACDGRLVRIAIGHERDPDAHLLYEWLPAAA